MTGLEIIKLCAEAMGIVGLEEKKGRLFWPNPHPTSHAGRHYYNPFHNDAQAMALVKKFDLEIGRSWRMWNVTPVINQRSAHEFLSSNVDLNSAICACVAKMQKEKKRI